MISKYLKTKNIIDQINPTVNIEELSKDISSDGYYYLKLSDQSSAYYYYRGLFNDYEIQKILSVCNKLPDQDGSLGGNKINKDIRESKISWVPVNNETLWIYQKFTDCINECNESFFEYDLTKIEKLQFTRYYGNQKGFYSPHIDCNYGHLNENRKLTFVMQLSDPEDYEGGELRLHMSKNYDAIPKEKGLITFFPSHTLHECTPVTFGTRYTLVGWVYGPKLK
jgi:PKHD-type hydroxylase